MHIIKNRVTKTGFRGKLIIVVVGIFIFELLISTIIVYLLAIGQIRTQLTLKIQRVRDDLHYTDNNWDMAAYNADPILVGKYPLYLITTSGFVLDRRSPIYGFLDTSDYRRLLTYTHPQTITNANQSRRIYAQPIGPEKAPIGVIAVSYFNPRTQLLSDIDASLIATSKKIASEVKIQHGSIDTQSIDERKLPYNISFTIVDKYNTTLRKTTNVNNIKRIPNFIDASYVKTQFSTPQERIIQDAQTGEHFLMDTYILKDKKGQPLGFVTVGQTIQPLFNLLKQYLIFEGALGSLLVIIMLIFSKQLLRPKYTERSNKNLSPHISFNEAKGIIAIDGAEIPIPYATNQFYLVQALFYKPTKRWETDELLKRFGEDTLTGNGRKVYDTMVKVNKKVSFVSPIKLILNQNKTYILNPIVTNPQSQ